MNLRAWSGAFEVLPTAVPRTLQLVGELDMATVERLRCAVAPVLEAPGDVTIDLSMLDFIDCYGLRAVLEIKHKMNGSGNLILAAPTGAVLRTLTLTNLDTEPGIHIVPAAGTGAL